MNIISREQWRLRYARRMQAITGLSATFAMEAASAALAAGDAEEHRTPEEAADEEISCWTDDEGAID